MTTKAAAAIGTSGQPARADHKHDVSTAAAVELTDSTNAEGAATSLARSNHTHAHGNRGGGTLHAAATTSVDGFMSAADKTAHDALVAAGPVRLTTRTITTATATADDGDNNKQIEAACTTADCVITLDAGTEGTSFVVTAIDDEFFASFVAGATVTIESAGDIPAAPAITARYRSATVRYISATLIRIDGVINVAVAPRSLQKTVTTTTYTLLPADHGYTIRFTNVAGCDVLINTASALGAGFVCNLFRDTVGLLQLDAASTVTFKTPSTYGGSGPSNQNESMIIEMFSDSVGTIYGNL
jgi:hypothetical protein